MSGSPPTRSTCCAPPDAYSAPQLKPAPSRYRYRVALAVSCSFANRLDENSGRRGRSSMSKSACLLCVVLFVAGSVALISPDCRAGESLDASSSKHTQIIYVPNDSSITEYKVTDDGDVMPLATLTGMATQIERARAAAIEPSGNLLVCNGSGVIARFAPGANGNTAPISTIAGATTMLSSCSGLVVDKAGHIFATSLSPTLGIYEFAPGASGDDAPIKAIPQGVNTQFHDLFGMALDKHGNIWVSDTNDGPIFEFAAGSNGDVAPIATIFGMHTGIVCPEGLAFAHNGDLLVADDCGNSIRFFKPGKTGDVAPVRTISGANTGINTPVGIAFDQKGEIIVANFGAPGVGRFSKKASGNATPLSTIEGMSTGLDTP